MRFQDPLIRAVVSDFHRPLVPRGEIAWVAEAGSLPVVGRISERARDATATLAPDDWPNVGIEEAQAGRLILVDAVSARGPMDEHRRTILEQTFSWPGLDLILVSAFK